MGMPGIGREGEERKKKKWKGEEKRGREEGRVAQSQDRHELVLPRPEKKC